MRITWAEHAYDDRNAYTNFAGILKGKRPLEISLDRRINESR